MEHDVRVLNCAAAQVRSPLPLNLSTKRPPTSSNGEWREWRSVHALHTHENFRCNCRSFWRCSLLELQGNLLATMHGRYSTRDMLGSRACGAAAPNEPLALHNGLYTDSARLRINATCAKPLQRRLTSFLPRRYTDMNGAPHSTRK
jgi:hypothetical protein